MASTGEGGSRKVWYKLSVQSELKLNDFFSDFTLDNCSFVSNKPFSIFALCFSICKVNVLLLIHPLSTDFLTFLKNAFSRYRGVCSLILSHLLSCVLTFLCNFNTNSGTKGKQGVNCASAAFIVIGLRPETQ